MSDIGKMQFPLVNTRSVEPVIPVPPAAAASGRLILQPGELLEALILRTHGNGTVTLRLKGLPVVADSRISLNAGERILLRVEQTFPNMILRMAGEAEIRTMADLLRLHRCHGGTLAELLSCAREVLDPVLIERHAGPDALRSAMALLKALDGTVLSKEGAANPFFIKDMMQRLGLLLERDLLKGSDRQDHGETAKALLLKLAAAIREGDAPRPLQTVLAFLERGIRSVEAHQIAALLGQELDHSLILQAACHFPAGIRMQDIFIEGEDDGPDGQKRFHATLLLSMNAIGEIIADASICGSRLDCVLSCETREACAFLTAMLPELRDGLAAAGYREPSVRCTLEPNMKDAKSERLARKKLFTLHAVDIRT